MLSEEKRLEVREDLRAASAAKDAHALLSAIRALRDSGKPADVSFCASALRKSGEMLVKDAGVRPVKAFLVRSVTVEPILPYLAIEAALAGLALDLTVGGYGSYMDEMMNPSGALAADSDFGLVMFWLDAEDIAGRLPDLCADGLGRGVAEELEQCVGRVARMLHSLRSRSACRIVVSGCVLPNHGALGEIGESNLPGSLRASIRSLNEHLSRLCGSIQDCVFFDQDHAAAGFGRAHWQDRRLFLASRLSVAPAAFPVFAHHLVRTVAAMFRVPRKVICTDLDNTLWGGVLGEEGPGGISTGSAYPGNCYLEYQRYLHRLRARGVLLAAVSKNNRTDVQEAFQLRSADLGLALTDFAALKISWGKKAEALRELACELSLGLDSFVFVDDNPAECEAIRQQLPEVAVITASIDEPWTLVSRLEAGGYFDVAMVTEADLTRAEEYKAQAARQALSQSAGSHEEFLGSLEMVCTVLPAVDAPLSRSVQLLAKTNQFNLTTRRHTALELEQFAKAPGGQAFVVRISDRFGDAGVVGLWMAKTANSVCLIDTLLLSCRVIGRGVETAMLAAAASRARADGAEWLIGEYKQSKKNEPCASFYAEHGFEICDPPAGKIAEGSTFYRYQLAACLPAYPSWMIIEGSEDHEHAASSAVTS